MPKDCRDCIFFSNGRCLKLNIKVDNPASPPCLEKEKAGAITLSLEDLEKIIGVEEKKPATLEEVFSEIREYGEEVEVSREEVPFKEVAEKPPREEGVEVPPVEIVSVPPKPKRELTLEEIIRKYNSVLEDLQKNLNSLSMLEEFKDTISPEVYEERKRELEEVIDEQQKKLKNLEKMAVSKGAIKCPQCNALNLPSSKVCTRCGRKLVERKKEEYEPKRKEKLKAKRFFTFSLIALGIILVYMGILNGDWSYLKSLIQIPCASCLKGLLP